MRDSRRNAVQVIVTHTSMPFMLIEVIYTSLSLSNEDEISIKIRDTSYVTNLPTAKADQKFLLIFFFLEGVLINVPSDRKRLK